MSQVPAQTLSATAKEALSWQEKGNQQIEQDIAELKAMGEPIYYEKNGKLIREDADGRKFEYYPLPDGGEEIITEITD